MKLPLYNQQGEKVGDVVLPKDIFGVEVNIDLMYQAVISQMANGRSNLAHTKQRGEVRGGGKKPWKQKGTGRARHGSIRSPIWIGGGITFGPRNTQNFSKKINKKMKKIALYMSLSSKVNDKQIIMLDNLEIKDGKTKVLVDVMNKINQVIETDKSKAPKKGVYNSLIVLPKKHDLSTRACGNIKKVKTILADSLNIVDILSYKNLILTKDSIDVIKKTYDIRKI